MRAPQEVRLKAAMEEWGSGTCMQVVYSCSAGCPKLILHFALTVVATFTAVGVYIGVTNSATLGMYISLNITTLSLTLALTHTSMTRLAPTTVN